MRKIAALIALSLLAMPSAGIDVQGRVWTLSEAEAKACEAQGGCEVYTGGAIAEMQMRAFKMGMEHQARQCGSRL